MIQYETCDKCKSNSNVKIYYKDWSKENDLPKGTVVELFRYCDNKLCYDYAVNEFSGWDIGGHFDKHIKK